MKNFRIKICTQKNGNQLIRLQERTMWFFWSDVRWRPPGAKYFRTYYDSIQDAEARLNRLLKFREELKQSKVTKCETLYR